MTASPAPRYIENLGIVFGTAKDKEHFGGLLQGQILRAELDEANGIQWISGDEDDDVEGHASDTLLSIIGGTDDDVEGHFHPGTYAPRFDLQTRDIETKAALQQAIKENRIRAFELEDRDGRTVQLNLLNRASSAVSAAGAAAISFAIVHAGAAQHSVQGALKLKL